MCKLLSGIHVVNSNTLLEFGISGFTSQEQAYSVKFFDLCVMLVPLAIVLL